MTQVRLTNQHWAYISAMTDEATKEVLALQVSAHPDKQLIMKTIDQLCANFPTVQSRLFILIKAGIINRKTIRQS